jgi:hypothetical protein
VMDQTWSGGRWPAWPLFVPVAEAPPLQGRRFTCQKELMTTLFRKVLNK